MMSLYAWYETHEIQFISDLQPPHLFITPLWEPFFSISSMWKGQEDCINNYHALDATSCEEGWSIRIEIIKINDELHGCGFFLPILLYESSILHLLKFQSDNRLPPPSLKNTYLVAFACS